MKLITSFPLLIALLLAAVPLRAQPTNAAPSAQTQLGELVKRVQVKANAGKTSEADYADELKALDELMAGTRGKDTNETAHIAFMKGMLYVEVIQNSDQAAKIFKQIAADYPQTEFGQNASQFLPGLERQAAAEKIQASLATGSAFPDFAEKDLHGQPLSVGALKGKVVLVDFWATWCPPCRAELPNVIAVFKQHHPDGLEIIGVSLDNNRDALESFLTNNPDMTWPQFFDGTGEDAPNWNNRLVTKYGVQAIPFTILVGPDGRILGKELRGDALEKAVNSALAKK
jgi:thiol-disulfide isomerase/thioredoxin